MMALRRSVSPSYTLLAPVGPSGPVGPIEDLPRLSLSRIQKLLSLERWCFKGATAKVAPGAAQAFTGASGPVQYVSPGITGIAVGDRADVAFRQGFAVLATRHPTGDRGMFCGGGTADPQPSTQIDKCKVAFSQFGGIPPGAPVYITVFFSDSVQKMVAVEICNVSPCRVIIIDLETLTAN
jgi:hypothetical protein